MLTGCPARRRYVMSPRPACVLPSPCACQRRSQYGYPPSPRLWHAKTTAGLSQHTASSSAGSSGHQRGCSLAPLPPPRTAFRETGRLLCADDCITSLHSVGPWTGCGPEGQVLRPRGGGSIGRGLEVEEEHQEEDVRPSEETAWSQQRERRWAGVVFLTMLHRQM